LTNRASHLSKQLLLMHDLEKYFGSAFERSSKISSSDDRLDLFCRCYMLYFWRYWSSRCVR